eukprot:4090035-Alexandrium_andersonii.AAC.1
MRRRRGLRQEPGLCDLARPPPRLPVAPPLDVGPRAHALQPQAVAPHLGVALRKSRPSSAKLVRVHPPSQVLVGVEG